MIPDSDEDADTDAVTDDEAIFSKPNHSDRERESRHCETRFKSEEMVEATPFWGLG